ncbi:hypothetical protein UPYG_G00189350 [Umbra pygmaea]|uniref:Uncharacterized protein n=1 Tax=Umbra pygmaea TaxID=75934 RepID=A0ABD0WSH0_UMBPY
MFHALNLNLNPIKGPPMWGPVFPPGPPTMPGFRMGRLQATSLPLVLFLQDGLPMMHCGPPMIPPPPPMSPGGEDDEALGSMLIAWYMSGYHTGYYLGLKQGRKEAASGRKSHHK